MVVPHYLLWCIWKERNSRCFEDIERSMPDIKLLFFKTLLVWFSVWRNHLFSSILDLLDFCNVRYWFVPPVYPCVLGCLSFFYQWNFITYQKKRYRIRFSNNKTQKPYHIVFLFHFFVLMKGHSDEIFKSSKNSLWRTIWNSRNLKCHFDAPLRLGPHLMIVIH